MTDNNHYSNTASFGFTPVVVHERDINMDDAMQVVQLNRIERARRENSAANTVADHRDGTNHVATGVVRPRVLPVVPLPLLQDNEDTVMGGLRRPPRLSHRPRRTSSSSMDLLSLPAAGLAPRWGKVTRSDIIPPVLGLHEPPSAYQTPKWNYARQHPKQPPSMAPKKAQATTDEIKELPKVTLKRRQAHGQRDGDFVIRRRSSPPSNQISEMLPYIEGFASSEDKLPYLPSELPDENTPSDSTTESNRANCKNWPLVGVSLIAPRKSKKNQVDTLLSFQNKTLSSPLYLPDGF